MNRIWGEMPLEERFGPQCTGILLLQEVNKMYQVPRPTTENSGKVVIQFFVVNKASPDGTKVRNVIRHPNNKRYQKSMHLKCKRSLQHRGWMGSCRGECLLVYGRNREPPMLAVGGGTMTDAFYEALAEDTNNDNIMLQMSLANGLEARVFHEDCWVVGVVWPRQVRLN